MAPSLVILVIMTIKTISVAEAKKRLSEILGRVAFGGEGFVIERRGRPIARIVPIDDGTHLADVKGWLGNDDPFFEEIDEIVRSRDRHAPRVVRPRKKARSR